MSENEIRMKILEFITDVFDLNKIEIDETDEYPGGVKMIDEYGDEIIFFLDDKNRIESIKKD